MIRLTPPPLKDPYIELSDQITVPPWPFPAETKIAYEFKSAEKLGFSPYVK